MGRKYVIYAVDFDGTLCESVFPGIGSPNMALINHSLPCRKRATVFLREYGLEFDAVNENLQEMIEWHGNDCRKIFADVYIDDKAKVKGKYRVPYKEER